ncbi:hypothetical protein TNCT_675291 [Trichonephila clavata]|uniref:Uncharacterized protein n=1 Tax=Trichonephila clavata TaxID=2740835 RepID=A0A8X6L730_TRICU|nr:hypothetical protein TNCT_675291 [Trichonephila clavata]
MAFLGKGLKADLQIMATERGVEDVLSLKVFELREAILNSKNFDEEFCREQLNTIIEERKRKEEMDLAERKRKEDIEFAERKRLDELEERKRKDEMDFELQKKRIELEGGGRETEVKESGQFKIDLQKLMPKACRDKNLNKQDSQKNKFSSPIKAQSNEVQAEDTTKNIVTAKIDVSESTCNFLTENIDKLKVIKVKCLDLVLDGTVDYGAQISVGVRADLVKDIECTGEGKIKLI